MESQGFLRRHATKLVASAVITGALLFTLRKAGLELWPPKDAFTHVRWWTVPVYLVSLIALSYFRAARWRFLLRGFADVPMSRILRASWVGFAAILIFPFRIGEIVRPYMIRERGKVSLARATGSVVGERVVDALYLSIVLVVALVVVPTRNAIDKKIPGLPNITVGYVRHASFLMLAIFSAAFATIALFYFARRFAERLVHRTVGLVSDKLATQIAETAVKLADGLHFLSRHRDAAGFMLETTLYWGLNALGMWLLGWGCGVTHADGTSISFGEACALMGTLGVTILIPGPPLLLGLFQSGIVAGLGMYFPDDVLHGAGIAYASLMFAIQFVWITLSGALSLVGHQSELKGLEDSEEAPSSSMASPAP